MKYALIMLRFTANLCFHTLVAESLSLQISTYLSFSASRAFVKELKEFFQLLFGREHLKSQYE